MPRTTEYEVRSVIETDEKISVAQFIKTAGVFTDRVSTKATDMGITVTAAELTAIETYLAAHFYALRDPQYQSKSTGKSQATFQGKTEMGLNLTWWGQQAIALDPTGTLDADSFEAGLTWLGTERT